MYKGEKNFYTDTPAQASLSLQSECLLIKLYKYHLPLELRGRNERKWSAVSVSNVRFPDVYDVRPLVVPWLQTRECVADC